MIDELFHKIIIRDIVSLRYASLSFSAENLMANFGDSIFLRMGPHVSVFPDSISQWLGEGSSIALPSTFTV